MAQISDQLLKLLSDDADKWEDEVFTPLSESASPDEI